MQPKKIDTVCPICGAVVPANTAGNRRVYCSGKCRQIAYRRRRKRGVNTLKTVV